MPRVLVVVAISLCFACATASKSTVSAPIHGASAAIEARSGSTVTGTAHFSQGDNGVTVHLAIAGATPGEHGVHIHEKGDCSDAKAASAGGHFNPGGMHHGGPANDPRHGGDLGNVTVDANGNGTLDVTVSGIAMNGEQMGVVGRSIVVHEKADDLTTDPSGNSGARLGCGVIEADKAEK